MLRVIDADLGDGDGFGKAPDHRPLRRTGEAISWRPLLPEKVSEDEPHRRLIAREVFSARLFDGHGRGERLAETRGRRIRGHDEIAKGMSADELRSDAARPIEDEAALEPNIIEAKSLVVLVSMMRE